MKKEDIPFEMPENVYWISEFMEPLKMIQYVQGIYFLGKENKCTYIGSSSNIITRIGSHLQNKWFDSIHYICTNGWERKKMESLEFYLISAFRPPLNTISVTIEKYHGFYDYDGNIRIELDIIKDPMSGILLSEPMIHTVPKDVEEHLISEIKYREEKTIRSLQEKEEYLDSLLRQNEKSKLISHLNRKNKNLAEENQYLNLHIQKLLFQNHGIQNLEYSNRSGMVYNYGEITQVNR